MQMLHFTQHAPFIYAKLVPDWGTSTDEIVVSLKQHFLIVRMMMQARTQYHKYMVMHA